MFIIRAASLQALGSLAFSSLAPVIFELLLLLAPTSLLHRGKIREMLLETRRPPGYDCGGGEEMSRYKIVSKFEVAW